MALPEDLVSQFVKATNDKMEPSITKTVYGTVVDDGDRKYVRIDGSNELTPVITTASINANNRVTVDIRNHTALVTGNLDEPSASSLDLSKVITRINSVDESINGIGFILNGNDEVEGIVAKVNSQQVALTEQGVAFTNLSDGLSNGSTIINGACIQTGKIKAEYLELSGQISFSDLNSDTQEAIQQSKKQFSSNLVDWHDTMTSTDVYRRDWNYTTNDWGSPYRFIGKDGIDGTNGTNGTNGVNGVSPTVSVSTISGGHRLSITDVNGTKTVNVMDGSDATIPTYITDTVIREGVIAAPQIYANDLAIYPSNASDNTGSFNIYGNYSTKQYHMFAIEYYSGTTPLVRLYSPASAPIHIGSTSTGIFYLEGSFDFSEADVTGLSVTAKFA